MPKAKIDVVELNKMLRAGKTPKQAAEYFGVSQVAICKARKGLNISVVKNIQLENAHRVVSKHLDTVDQLQKINHRAHEILDALTESQINQKLNEILSTLAKPQEEEETRSRIHKLVKEIFTDQTVVLKACGEIRQQLELQLSIFQTLYDLQEIEGFQREVLDAIQSVSPELKAAIIAKLKERRALRPSAILSGS